MDTSAEAWLEKHFLTQVFPILTPQALDPAHPFPFIPNQGLSVVFDLVRLSDKEPVRELVMIPPTLSRWVRIPGKRSEEHTSELQSLMRISYAVFCLQKKKKKQLS